MLRIIPLPTVETAYAIIRRETSRRTIMSGVKLEETHPEVGSGLAAKGRSDRGKAQSSSRIEGSGKNRSENVKGPEEEGDKAKLRCTHCGGTKHTRDGCFKLIGYPDWWPGKKGQQQRNTGASAIAVGDREAAGSRDGEDPGIAAVAKSASKETEAVTGKGLRDTNLSLSPCFSNQHFFTPDCFDADPQISNINRTAPICEPLYQIKSQEIGKCLVSSGENQKKTLSGYLIVEQRIRSLMIHLILWPHQHQVENLLLMPMVG